jgi:hypothetical protein
MVIDELDKIMRMLCGGLMGLMALPMTKRLELRPSTVPGDYMLAGRDHLCTDRQGTTTGITLCRENLS